MRSYSKHNVLSAQLDSKFQKKIISEIEGGASIWKIAMDIIEDRRNRDAMLYGMWARYMGHPASMYEWLDPREADGVPILARPAISETDINDRLHFPFDRTIASNKASYAASSVVTEFDEETESIEDRVKDFENLNSFKMVYSNMMETCADRGTSYIMLFVDGMGRARVMQPKEWEAIVVYDEATGEPKYGMRYWKIHTEHIGEQWHVEWYDGINYSVYIGVKDGPAELIENGPHGFGTIYKPGIPLIEFPNNKDRIGNVELTISMQDAYDLAMSDLSTEMAQTRLAYLVAKMLGGDPNDVEFLEKIKKTGVFVVDDANGDVKFVTKEINTEAIKFLVETLNHQIYQKSKSYDPDSLGEGEQTAYQIQQKLFGLEQDSKVTWAKWQKSFRYMDERLSVFWGIDFNPMNIKRSFVPNVPRNRMADLKQAQESGLQLSNKTKIEQSVFDIDPEMEAERLMEEGAVVEQIGGFDESTM